MNKLDYLRAEVQVIDPDIIAISESWTNESIGDSELNLTGYTLFRKDRELDIKGGGVLMYVKDCLNASEVKFKSDFPEQVWCKVMCNGNTELFIGVCYRTPSENVYGYGIHASVTELVREISNKNFVLFGDFNYRGIDWASNGCDSSVSAEARFFFDCINDCCIMQHVDFLTTDKSILDLFFSGEPDIVCYVQDLANFSSSDHKLIFCNLDIAAKTATGNKTKYDYNRMDVHGMKEELSLINWTSVLTGSVDECWERFKSVLLKLWDKFVPASVVKSKGKVPWMSYKAAKLVRKKHRVFKKYKDKDHPACKRASRVASCEVKKAKYNFERKLAENIKDTKSFYANVKGRAKAGRSIGPLVNDENVVVDSAEEMSQEFDKFFSSVFTKERTGEVPEANWVYKENDNALNDIDITEEKVSAKLDKLRDDKAAGADDLLARFLGDHL